jgi:proteasome lid subunit RPN8/RPN11
MALILMELRTIFDAARRSLNRALGRLLTVKITLKIRSELLDEILTDLRRGHPFAAERVGFIIARPTRSQSGIILFASRYVVVPDDGYAEDYSAGAVMNERTIFGAMQIGYAENVSVIHVHLHDHLGKPGFSPTDRRESAKFVPAFLGARPEYPHAAIVLSADSFVGACWLEGKKQSVPISRVVVVGPHLRVVA